MSWECPYPSPEAHTVPPDSNGRCQECLRPLCTCPACATPNRATARFCRRCGGRLPNWSWSCLGGQRDSPILQANLQLAEELTPLWSRPLEEPLGTVPLAASELLVAVHRSGRVEVALGTGPEPVYRKPLPGVQDVVASPALLENLLLVVSGERLFAADLVDLLEASPGTGSRKRVIDLKGAVCSHLASDGERYAALATVSEREAWVYVFELSRSGLQLLWKRSPCRLEESHPFLCLAVAGERLVVGEPGGRLWSYSIPSGRAEGETRLPVGLFQGVLLPRGDFVLAAGADGSVFRLPLESGISALAVSEPMDPLYAMGASAEDVLCCHGRLLRRINLRSGRVSTLQIPQHCTVEPLVARNLALALSNDGTLYALGLATDHFQVLASRKVLSAAEPGVLPPVATRNHLFVAARAGELAALRLVQRAG